MLNALAKSGHKVIYLSLDTPPNATIYPDVEFCRIPFPIKSRSGVFFWMLFVAWSPVYTTWVSLKRKPDRYLAFNPFYAAILSIPRLFQRAPLVLFIRSLVFKINEINEKPKILRLLSNFLDRIGILVASKVVCMTTSMEKDLASFLGQKIKGVEILPNDIPPVPQKEIILKAKSDTLVILTSGIINRGKNISYLLDVFSQLEAKLKDPKLELIIAGDGPLLHAHKKAAVEQNLKCIKFVGWSENLSELYREASIVVHPSLHEGVPNSIMEALAYELPVLASDTPELRELMGDSRLLFETTDPTSLANKLEELLNDPTLLEDLRRLCAERKARYSFDWDVLATNLVIG